MRILVTGATGRIGSRLVPRLLQRGHLVRALVRQEEQAEDLAKHGVEPVIGDLRAPVTLGQAAAGMDAVVHLAAFFRGATDQQARETNEQGTIGLARAARGSGVSKFVFVSTSLVYGPGRGRPAREEDELKPTGAYPTAKAAAERALQDLDRTHGPGLTILRLAFVYGEGDPHLAEVVNFVRRWNPAKRMHMVHHADVDQAIMLALDTQNGRERVYNVADDEPAAAAELMHQNGLTVTDEAKKQPIEDPWETIVDTRRIRKELAFRPIHPSLRAAQDAQAL